MLFSYRLWRLWEHLLHLQHCIFLTGIHPPAPPDRRPLRLLSVLETHRQAEVFIYVCVCACARESTSCRFMLCGHHFLPAVANSTWHHSFSVLFFHLCTQAKASSYLSEKILNTNTKCNVFFSSHCVPGKSSEKKKVLPILWNISMEADLLNCQALFILELR